jgi:flap endonuclease-1
MGVDLSSIIEKKEITLDYLSRKNVALDAYNILYQFLASIRQPDGTALMDFRGNVTSHLSGLFYRTAKLMEVGIRPAYVFDGEPPKFKLREIELRRAKKDEAMLLLKKAQDQENEVLMRSYAQATVRLTQEMVRESKELLSAMGVPCVDAPSEGEGEAAFLAKAGKAYASGSQDYDSLLFGSPRLVRNLSITGKRKLPRRDEYIIVRPEVVELDSALGLLGITREQLVMIGILTGTDFNDGVKGVGAKTALKLVKQYGNDFDALIKAVEQKYEYRFEEYIYDVYQFFLNYPGKEKDLPSGEIDEAKVAEMLVERHDFTKERIENTLKALAEARKNEKQTRMSDWFGQ